MEHITRTSWLEILVTTELEEAFAKDCVIGLSWQCKNTLNGVLYGGMALIYSLVVVSHFIKARP